MTRKVRTSMAKKTIEDYLNYYDFGNEHEVEIEVICPRGHDTSFCELTFDSKDARDKVYSLLAKHCTSVYLV
jgi:hypothetical protein